MPEIYFTSDLHFSHENIIRYCYRPFSCADEMNEKLISNWNELVRDKDEVYVLGDVVWFASDLDLLDRMRGKKYLILGNHDNKNASYKKYYQWVEKLETIKINKQKIVLCHYPMRAWDGSFHGSWHLHGHVHSRPHEWTKDRSLDVGVDKWGYFPVHYDVVKDYLSSRELHTRE